MNDNNFFIHASQIGPMITLNNNAKFKSSENIYCQFIFKILKSPPEVLSLIHKVFYMIITQEWEISSYLLLTKDLRRLFNPNIFKWLTILINFNVSYFIMLTEYYLREMSTDYPYFKSIIKEIRDLS